LHHANTTTTVSKNKDMLEAPSTHLVSKNHQALQESLMFVVHIVGDLHQPLHASRLSGRGGNSIQVQYDFEPATELRSRAIAHTDCGTFTENVHHIWDAVMIERCIAEDYGGVRSNMDDSLMAEVCGASSEQWSKWLTCPNGSSHHCVTQWADESLEQALAWAYANVNGTEINSGMKLSRDYYKTRMPIVKHQLQTAGVRLAAALAIAITGKKLLAPEA
jgi:hypothetical protein